MSIFWDFSNYDKIELLPCPIITTGTQDMGNGVYKLAAGTPLKKSTQAVSNDANADCVVAEDYFFISTKADQSKLVPVITKGYVDKALAEAAWGGEFTDAAVSALETAGIFLVDGALEAGGGDPGYDVETVTTSIIPEQTVTPTMGDAQYVAFPTLAAGVDAAPDSLTVIVDGVEYTPIVTDFPEISGKSYDADDGSFGIIIGIPPGGTNLFAQIYGESLPASVTVEAYIADTTVTVTDGFKAAVEAAVPSGGGALIVEITSEPVSGGNKYTANKTAREIIAAMPLVYVLVEEEDDGVTTHAYHPCVTDGVPAYDTSTDGYGFRMYVSDLGDTLLAAHTLDDYPSYGNGK